MIIIIITIISYWYYYLSSTCFFSLQIHHGAASLLSHQLWGKSAVRMLAGFRVFGVKQREWVFSSLQGWSRLFNAEVCVIQLVLFLAADRCFALLKSSWSQKCTFNPLGPCPCSYCSHTSQKMSYFAFLYESTHQQQFGLKFNLLKSLNGIFDIAVIRNETKRIRELLTASGRIWTTKNPPRTISNQSSYCWWGDMWSY